METPVPTYPRRFYKHAAAFEADDGFALKLDERRLKTPKGAAFTAPTRALADAMVEEWNAQAEHIIPTRMPLTQFAFAAIDATAPKRDEVADYIAKFGETDLCCHRAASPVDLVAHQDAHWSSLRDWLHAYVGADLPVVTGVLPADVPQGELAKLRAAARALDDFRLTALAQATGLSGSAMIGFAILHEKVTPAAAFEAAALDELWSQEKWGADAEAQARLARQKAEFEALARFVAALT